MIGVNIRVVFNPWSWNELVVIRIDVKVASSHIMRLVWTPCLMHRCVCIWQYILQDCNYKLHFQNLLIYHISHVFIGTLAAENFYVCTACDPWESNIQLTMVKDWRQQIYPKCHSTILIYQNLGGASPGARHAFPRQRHIRRERGGYLFLSGFSSLYDAIHGWMTRRMDGWKKLHEKRPRRPLLYVMSWLWSEFTCYLKIACTLYFGWSIALKYCKINLDSHLKIACTPYFGWSIALK
jgi:hypothetical protein